MVTKHSIDNFNYFIYLRKSDNYDLCLVLSNYAIGIYRGFDFKSYLLNEEEKIRLKTWARNKNFNIIKDHASPNRKEIILVDDIKYPTLEQTTFLKNRISCTNSIIINGPQHISDSGITMFMKEPSILFKNISFDIYPEHVSLLDLWAMNINTTQLENFNF